MSPSTANPSTLGPAATRSRDVVLPSAGTVELTATSTSEAAGHQVATGDHASWRPKQIHPIELTFLCTAARSIRLRGR